MNEKNNNNGTWIVLIVLISILFGGIASYSIFPNYVPVEGKQTDCQAQCKALATPCAVYNDSAIKSDILAVKSEVLKDSDWEELAKTLATDEMEAKDYKEVYNALLDLNMSIDDKSDVDSVYIKHTDISDTDVEEKDATVEFDLRVSYTNSDGDEKRAYLTLTTYIVDNEVDETEYVLTD